MSFSLVQVRHPATIFFFFSLFGILTFLRPQAFAHVPSQIETQRTKQVPPKTQSPRPSPQNSRPLPSTNPLQVRLSHARAERRTLKLQITARLDIVSGTTRTTHRAPSTPLRLVPSTFPSLNLSRNPPRSSLSSLSPSESNRAKSRLFPSPHLFASSTE